jgi:hypothetical protein
LFLFLATPAFAQSQPIEDACKTVAKNFFLTEKLNVGVAQAFPALIPPGVRMSYSRRPDTPKDEMSDVFECEFKSAQPPYELSRFCVSRTCYSPESNEGEEKRRFEQMHDLLGRSQ